MNSATALVVDGSGRPVIMYHGARPGNDFETSDFKLPRFDGVYFSSNREYAMGFTTIFEELVGRRGWLHSAYLRLRNPATFVDPLDWERINYRGFNKSVLINAGHDGIVMRLFGSPAEVLAVVFDTVSILPLPIDKQQKQLEATYQEGTIPRLYP